MEDGTAKEILKLQRSARRRGFAQGVITCICANVAIQVYQQLQKQTVKKSTKL